MNIIRWESRYRCVELYRSLREIFRIQGSENTIATEHYPNVNLFNARYWKGDVGRLTDLFPLARDFT